jgi:molybdenum cofactor biosynthesis protein B
VSGIRIATITCSDTRTESDDEGGALLRSLLGAAGFTIASHQIVREDLELVRGAVRDIAASEDVDAIVLTGGTGIGPRDVTIDAIGPLLDKTLPGFGEAFRRLSWDQVGARSILSNATAGVALAKIVVALPGSPKAVRLAIEALVAPTLAHMVALAQGRTAHGKAGA